MARRSAPPNSGPAYYSRSTVPHASIDDIDGAELSAFSRFMRDEIRAPEKLPGNIAIFTGVGIFAAGVAAIRTWGELLNP
jgi:hypothetical protein